MSNNVSMRSGMIWTAFQKFGNMGVSFISNIILARLLLPEQYGTIGILMAFIAFSEIFIDGGFASALIQKKDVSDKEYNSVFLFNISISMLFYLLLIVFAPIIASFFNDDNLTPTLKVIGIVLITNSLSIIQITQIQKHLQFKTLAYYNLISVVAGTAVAIVIAIYGFGVWSLVLKNLITSLVLCIIVWIGSNWRPKLEFSFAKVRGLFNYGGFIFMSTLIEYAYAYTQPVLIGKFFSMSELGFFSQARKIEEIPSNSLLFVVTSVTFPVLSKFSDNITLLVEKVSQALRLVSYLTFPIMTWLMLCSEEVITILLGDKWIDAAPLLQILCIAGTFRVPSGCNMCLIKSIGKSKAFMYIQIIKRLLGISCILIGLCWSLMGLMWGFSISSFVFFVVDSLACGHYIGYGLIKQIRDLIPIGVITFVAGLSCYILKEYVFGKYNVWLDFIFVTSSFCAIYLIISAIFKSFGFVYYRNLIVAKFRHKMK